MKGYPSGGFLSVGGIVFLLGCLLKEEKLLTIVLGGNGVVALGLRVDPRIHLSCFHSFSEFGSPVSGRGMPEKVFPLQGFWC